MTSLWPFVLSFTIPAWAVGIFLGWVLNIFLLSEECGKNKDFNVVFNAWECWWIRLRYVEYTAKSLVVLNLATRQACITNVEIVGSTNL